MLSKLPYQSERCCASYCYFAFCYPRITTEFRTQLTKVAKTNAEPSKKSIRYVRQKAINKAKKTTGISKDEIKRAEKTIDTLTSHYVTEVDNLLDAKCRELMGNN